MGGRLCDNTHSFDLDLAAGLDDPVLARQRLLKLRIAKSARALHLSRVTPDRNRLRRPPQVRRQRIRKCVLLFAHVK